MKGKVMFLTPRLLDGILEELERWLLCYEPYSRNAQLIEAMIDDIEENGFQSKCLYITDTDEPQFAIKLADQVLVYSEKDKRFHDWKHIIMEEVFEPTEYSEYIKT